MTGTLAKSLERVPRRSLAVWRDLSLDAKVFAAFGIGNWLLLFANHTSVGVTSDITLWRFFPAPFGALWLALCGALAIAYPYRDRRSRPDASGRSGAAFTTRDRAVHLALLIAAFVIAPTIASIVLRETGKPYTYVHDGALMVEEAARKLLRGQNPYVADYVDTPLLYWPMVNNPALYHFTYFPFLFLVTAPFVWLFDRLGAFWDQRYLFVPAFVATLVAARYLVDGADRRLAIVALVALNPQLFPFVVEGRNDFFVLVFLFAALALLQRGRRTLATLALAAAAAAKLHAAILLPFWAVYLVASARPRSLREALGSLAPTLPAVAFLAVNFVPFLVNDFDAFWDDVVRYNAGGAAWSYPISGMGFSALLLAIRAIPYRQADFPFWIFELAAALPIAAWWLRKLWREPTVATMLTGYALTLLAFLFFGRYFQGNYLGYIAAVATPVLFFRPRRGRRRVRLPVMTAVALPVSMPADAPVLAPVPADAGATAAE